MNTSTERPTPAERAALLSSSEYKAAARRLKAQLRAILRLKEFVARANRRDPMFKAEMGRTIVVALTQFLDAEEAKEREAA